MRTGWLIFAGKIAKTNFTATAVLVSFTLISGLLQLYIDFQALCDMGKGSMISLNLNKTKQTYFSEALTCVL